MSDMTSNQADVHCKSKITGVSVVGLSFEESQAAYNRWAQTYEQDLLNSGFTGPVLAAKYLADMIPEKERVNTHVIDIGAGTGLVSVELRKLGFKKIDGLEPNPEMLAESRKRNLYNLYFQELITASPLDIQETQLTDYGVYLEKTLRDCRKLHPSYDAITGSGIIGEGGHVEAGALTEMIRLVKPGGYIVLANRRGVIEDCVTHRDTLEPLMAKLESQGRWKRLVRDTGVNLYADREAVVFVYQVL